jgi:antitoxin PrlF
MSTREAPKNLYSTLTTKGQVTIPAEVRRLLGVKPHDKIVFVVDADQVRISRSESVVARTAGALRSRTQAVSAEELRSAAETAVAGEAVARAKE